MEKETNKTDERQSRTGRTTDSVQFFKSRGQDRASVAPIDHVENVDLRVQHDGLCALRTVVLFVVGPGGGEGDV